MPNRRRLVLQHLENISRDALEEHQDILREHVRGKHGVYALYRRGALYYVGLASNLRGRLKTHLRDRHRNSWDRFSVYLTVSDGHVKELESLILRIVKPPGNKQSGRFAKSKNLKAEFADDVRSYYQGQADDILGRRRTRRVVISKGRKRSDKKPELAGCFKRAARLWGSYKGEDFVATVRKDGTIRYGKTVYKSPSKAATAARGISTNGWGFWFFRDASGEWVRLRQLKK